MPVRDRQPDLGGSMGKLSRVAAIPAGSWTKWLVVGFWVVVVAVAYPLAGKLTGAEKNDASSWLPASAESVKVLDVQQRFQSPNTFSGVVVYDRAAGLTAADRAKAAADARRLAGLHGVVRGQVTGPIPAADGKAMQTIVPVNVGTQGWNGAIVPVGSMRAITRAGANGLASHVTGQLGYAADNAKEYKGITSRLLYAALAVVIVILLISYRSPVLWLLPVISSVAALITADAVVYLLAAHAGLTVNEESAAILDVLVFGASTDYALLIVARHREELRRHDSRHPAMATALRRAGPAIIASASTVIIALLMLSFAQLNSTSGLGPVLAIGVTVGVFAMLTGLQASGLTDAQGFRGHPDSVAGQALLAAHFPAGAGEPVIVVGSPHAAVPLGAAFAAIPGIAHVTSPVTRAGHAYLQGTLTAPPDSQAAYNTIDRVRAAVHAVPGARALVGGQSAVNLDVARASDHDRTLLLPLILAVVLVILAILLRALVAPLILTATVVLSFAAALGVSAFFFTHVFGFGGADNSFPLLVYVFLVALGIDSNIFLMTRAREEAHRRDARHGAITGLAATGGVITSAGFVLAGTFAALATIPSTFSTELGFAVAFGILLDTIVVRSVLVTALNLDAGRWMWWPSRLARTLDPAPAELSQERASALTGSDPEHRWVPREDGRGRTPWRGSLWIGQDGPRMGRVCTPAAPSRMPGPPSCSSARDKEQVGKECRS